MANPYLRTSGCLANFIIVLCLGIPTLVFYLIGEPYKRGFFCDDESISHPYLDSTVSSTALYIVCFSAPPLAVIVVETLFVSGVGRKAHLSTTKTLDIGGKYSVKVPEYLINIYTFLLMYLFGAACSQLLTDTAKYTIGRLRPHFFDACKPDWANIVCYKTENGVQLPLYVTNYTCLGNYELFTDKEERDHRVHDAHLSFVSGHASFSFQAMTFMAMYLQARLVRRNKPPRTLLIPLWQLAGVVFAFFTSLSRVSDYKHHPGDVLFGGILGASVQAINCLYLVKMFRVKSLRVDDVEANKLLTEDALVVTREGRAQSVRGNDNSANVTDDE